MHAVLLAGDTTAVLYEEGSTVITSFLPGSVFWSKWKKKKKNPNQKPELIYDQSIVGIF